MHKAPRPCFVLDLQMVINIVLLSHVTEAKQKGFQLVWRIYSQVTYLISSSGAFYSHHSPALAFVQVLAQLYLRQNGKSLFTQQYKPPC